MDQRKGLILDTIIREHIKTGVPVGSGIIVEKYKLGISPATVRNEMAALEEEGYIMQPHTSAGRVPTEKAYQLYLKNLPADAGRKNDFKNLADILRDKDEAGFKEAAKVMAGVSGNAVFWAFHRHNLYYTGISNLFQQPEFRELDMIYDISAVIDRIDEIVDDMYEDMKPGLSTFVGTKNPFGDLCSTVLAKYKWGERTGLFGVIGPMRMDYEKNIALIKYVFDKIGG